MRKGIFARLVAYSALMFAIASTGRRGKRSRSTNRASGGKKVAAARPNNRPPAVQSAGDFEHAHPGGAVALLATEG